MRRTLSPGRTGAGEAHSRPCPRPKLGSGRPMTALDAPKVSRRARARKVVIYRVVRVRTNNDDFLCRACALWVYGMQLLTGIRLGVGSTVTIAFAENMVICGVVQSQRGTRINIRFDEAVDIETCLESLTAPPVNGVRRPARLPLDERVVVYSSAGPRSCQLVNISQCGLNLRHAGELKPGMPVTVALPNGTRRSAVVRWVDGGNIAGIQLIDILSLEDVEALASRTRSGRSGSIDKSLLRKNK